MQATPLARCDLMFQRLLEHPLFKSFVAYSIFRAFYGAAILIFTWFFATETDAPLWVSIAFLLCSMIFSRVLFRYIKKRRDTNQVVEV